MPKRTGGSDRKKQRTSGASLPEMLVAARAARLRVLQLAARLEAVERTITAAMAASSRPATPAATPAPRKAVGRPAAAKPASPKPAARKRAVRKPAVRRTRARG